QSNELTFDVRVNGVSSAAPAQAPTGPAHPIGQPVVLSNTTGTVLALTVNSVKDGARSSNQFNKPAGRWVAVDGSVSNLGSINLTINPLDFVLQTVDGFIVNRG